MEEKKEDALVSVEKEQKLLKSSYEMYEKTIAGTREKLSEQYDKNTGERMYSDEVIDDRIGLIKEAEKDIIDRFLANGGTMQELERPEKKKRVRKAVADAKAKKLASETVPETPEKPSGTASMPVNPFLSDKVKSESTAFDIIPLPSKGECYPGKISKIPVSFLTAYDENIIVSPNLYQENMVIDYILSRKIMSDDIDPDEMLDGDREAVILYLRAAGYGNEYPVTATDGRTGEEFDTVVDLSEVKFKEFNLVGDEDGHFEYTLPVSGRVVKFKFLNHAENKELDRITKEEMKGGYRKKVEKAYGDLKSLIDNDGELEGSEKMKVRESLAGIKKWSELLSEEDSPEYSHLLTNKLEMEIVSVDGNSDRKFIKNFVKNMCVKDSSSLRKYINKNEPGLDYTFTVQKPESLGGGSMEIFLEFDQYIFLNVSE